MTHYERLGVLPTASAVELRHAYRLAARAVHPDRHGDGSSAQMAELNEAWRVLSDPARRHAYDLQLLREMTSVAAAPGSSHAQAEPKVTEEPAETPRRMRWPLVLSIEVLALLAVIGMSMLTSWNANRADATLSVGECVLLHELSPPAEVSCLAPHDGVVERVVPFGQSCPEHTLPHRTRSGRTCIAPVDDPAQGAGSENPVTGVEMGPRSAT